MGTDYIPERDLKAAVWMKHFASALVTHPDLYRTTPTAAAQIDALVQAFRAANALCWPAGDRNRSKVTAKNQARAAAERLVRPEAQRIRTDPQIEPALKVAIDLKPPGKRQRHIAPPASVPWLALTAQMSGRVHIRVSDSASGRRGRPRAAIGMELYERVQPMTVVEVTAGETQAVPPSSAMPGGAGDGAWRFVGTFTRTPFRIEPSTRTPGDAVILVGRWVTRRGEVGAFGNPKGIHVLFGVTPRLGVSMNPHRRAA